jgi:hypothetical protein
MNFRAALRASAVVVLCLSAARARAAAAQGSGDLFPGVSAVSPVVIGSVEEDDARLAHLESGAPTDGFLLRSLSTRLLTPLPSGSGWRVQLLIPRLDATRNSDIPYSINTGSVWAGRGWNARILGGLEATFGAASIVLAPELVYEENRDFRRFREPYTTTDSTTVVAPWYRGRYSADLPIRLGEGQSTRLHLGQSALALRAGPVSAGASTEEQWWGPGIRNALVLSNNAPGIGHLFLRTSRPLATPLGDVEARWVLGELSESSHFDADSANDSRSLSALAVTLRPAGEPGLTLGVARAVYGAKDGGGLRAGRFFDVLSRWEMTGDVPDPSVEEVVTSNAREQVLSLFARWVFPADGLEVYGEWARTRLPSSLGDLLDRPSFSQGYTVGLQGSRAVGGDWRLRLQGEATFLEQSTRNGEPGSFYTSPSVVQGYTHRGRVVGAAIGPGGSSQWLATDLFAPGWSVGLFATRIRWDNDAYFHNPRGPRFMFGHDVSLLGGVRARYQSRWGSVSAELGTGTRYDFLFQNLARDFPEADSAVDVRNRTLRISVAPRLGAAPPTPLPPRPPAPLPTSAGSAAIASLPAAVARAELVRVTRPGNPEHPAAEVPQRETVLRGAARVQQRILHPPQGEPHHAPGPER